MRRRRALSEASYDRFDSEVVEWLVHSLFELLYAALALMLFAAIKRQIKRRLAKAAKAADKATKSDKSKSRRAKVAEMAVAGGSSWE